MDEMPDPFRTDRNELTTEETDLINTTEAISDLQALAALVGFDLEAGLEQICDERTAVLDRPPYGFTDLVDEITGHALAMVDRVRAAFPTERTPA